MFQDKPNPTQILRTRRTWQQKVALFFRKTDHVATVPLEIRRRSILNGTQASVR